MKTKKKSNSTYIIPIAVMLIVAAVIVALALFVNSRGDGDDTDTGTVGTKDQTDTSFATDGTTDNAETDGPSDDTTDETTEDDTTDAETEDTVDDTASVDVPPSVDVTDGEIVICIDAGHGFEDVGCSTDLIYDIEAVITLDIAERLASALSEHDVTVILTHDGESFPSSSEIKAMADERGVEYDETRIIKNNIFSAYERVIYANAVNKETPIDFFVSIHVNSIVDHPEISRYEMFYYEDSAYVDLITKFTDSIRDKLDNDSVTIAKGPTDAYTVTRWAEFPSLLIEVGYATNEDDAAKLNSVDWRQSFAELLASEIVSVTGAE